VAGAAAAESLSPHSKLPPQNCLGFLAAAYIISEVKYIYIYKRDDYAAIGNKSGNRCSTETAQHHHHASLSYYYLLPCVYDYTMVIDGIA
jgi:hypothetical protein